MRPENGPQKSLKLHGVTITAEGRPRAGEMLKRVTQARCELLPRDEVKVDIYGWQDKSGDVWFDLAELLVKEGLARPDRR